jgi:uncharacterized protein
MKLSVWERKEFISLLQELLEKEQVHQMKNYIQHGNTSTFTHCLIVAYYSYTLALRLPGEYDIKSIVRGAMLHDFYLYDWHIPDKSHRLHGFFHPQFALRNARKYFKLNSIEADIIEKHMWPLTLSKIPVYKEALLVCSVDKYISLAESFYIPVLPKDYRRLQRTMSAKKLVTD